MAVQQKQLAPTVLKCFSVTYVTLQHITAVSVAVLVLQKLCNVQWEMVTVATQPCYVESDLFHGNQKLLWHSGHPPIIICLVLVSQRE